MVLRYVVSDGTCDRAGPAASGRGNGARVLDWTSDLRNAICDARRLRALAGDRWTPQVEDLLSVATAVYLADIASSRGELEDWVRRLHITVPVHDPERWTRQVPLLAHLLYTLTRDGIALEFTPRLLPVPPVPEGRACEADCVCLLSGGLDSFSGAVMAVSTGRRPLLLSHLSGNPTTEVAQKDVAAAVERLAPGATTWLPVRVAPHGAAPDGRDFPPPDRREPSRRARSFLFVALGAIAAVAIAAPEVLLCENGFLSIALPLTPARSGGLSTRSTHPLFLALCNELLPRVGVQAQVVNPLIHQTKGEVLRTCLRSVIEPATVMRSVSCWAAGRQNRQCGGCVPCILRRVAMLAAGYPDEAYMIDLLAEPGRYKGTEAYRNLVDFLAQARDFGGMTDLELLRNYPQLLDLETATANVPDAVAMLRRHAAEVVAVLQSHFPASADLLSHAHT